MDYTSAYQKAMTGDQEGFRFLYDSTAQPVYEFLLTKLGDQPKADQMIGKVYEQAWAGLGNLANPEEFPGWVYNIAENMVTQEKGSIPVPPIGGGEAAGASSGNAMAGGEAGITPNASHMSSPNAAHMSPNAAHASSPNVANMADGGMQQMSAGATGGQGVPGGNLASVGNKAGKGAKAAAKSSKAAATGGSGAKVSFLSTALGKVTLGMGIAATATTLGVGGYFIAKKINHKDEPTTESTEISSAEIETEASTDVAVTTEATTEAASTEEAKVAKDDGFTGHKYQFIVSEDVNTHSWEEAVLYCQNLGGYMAVISSPEENAYLTELFNEGGYEVAYFAYTDANEEGKWQWVGPETSSYVNWHEGEPNDQDGLENYGLFYCDFSDGTWNDGDFSADSKLNAHVFICEWGVADGTSDGGKTEEGQTEEKTTEEAKENADFDVAEMKQDYLAKIEAFENDSDHADYEKSYNLIYVNDDDIPELVCQYKFDTIQTSQNGILYTWKDGEVIELGEMAEGLSTCDYYPRKNYIDAGGAQEEMGAVWYSSVWRINETGDGLEKKTYMSAAYDKEKFKSQEEADETAFNTGNWFLYEITDDGPVRIDEKEIDKSELGQCWAVFGTMTRAEVENRLK